MPRDGDKSPTPKTAMRGRRALTFLGCLAFLIWTPVRAEDEVLSAMLRDALAASLVGDSTRIASIHAVLAEDESEDAASWSGLLDDVATLDIVSSSDTRQEKARKLRNQAKELNDPVARERLSALADRVESYRLDDLIKKRRWNRVSGVVNRAIKTTSEVATGQPRALAVAGVDTVYAVTGRGAPTTVDRKIAYLAQLQELNETASPEDLAKARDIASKLEEKSTRHLIEDWKDRILLAEEEGDPVRAERLAGLASEIWPEEIWFAERLGEIQARAPQAQMETPVAAAPLTREERARIELLSRELARPPERVETVSDTPSRSLIATANDERRSKTLDYLIFGDTRFETHRAARTVAAQGAGAPATLGILQGFETVVRGASLFFKNELGAKEAIEAYAYADRSNPGTLTEKDYLKWADLCAEVEDYAGAIEVLESAGVEDSRRVEKYRSKWADSIVKRCKDLPPGKDRFGALQFVLDELKGAKGARKAETLLAETPSVDRPLVLIETKDLRDREAQAMEAGLRFDRGWWDKDPANGEVEKDQFYWDPQGSVWYRVEKKSPWRCVRQSEESLPRLSAFFAALEEISVARSLAEKRRGQPVFPIEIEGGLGSENYLVPKIVERDIRSDDDWLFE